MTRLTEEQYLAFIARGHAAQRAVDGIARRRIGHPEDDLQRAVCMYWAREYPATWLKTFHPPNGLAARNPKLAAIFQGLGMKPGVFDLICIARRGPFNGFALELKSAHGSMSDKQSEWQRAFVWEGWCVALAFALDPALAAIDQYHKLPSAVA